MLKQAYYLMYRIVMLYLQTIVFDITYSALRLIRAIEPFVSGEKEVYDYDNKARHVQET